MGRVAAVILPRVTWLPLGLLLAGCTTTETVPASPAAGVTPVEYPPPTPVLSAEPGPADPFASDELARPAPASVLLETSPAPAPTPHPAARLYVDALRRERSYDYPAAIELYDEILWHRPGYLDASERRHTLRAFVELADELYAQADRAPPEEERILLRMIEVFWPEYEDVHTRLEELD